MNDPQFLIGGFVFACFIFALFNLSTLYLYFFKQKYFCEIIKNKFDDIKTVNISFAKYRKLTKADKLNGIRNSYIVYANTVFFENQKYYDKKYVFVLNEYNNNLTEILELI